MQRTIQKERKENAKTFIEILKKKGKNAIVIEKTYSNSNPNITRTKFISCNHLGAKMVIAESPIGIDFCMIEFLDNIDYKGVQKTYFEPEFKEWFEKEVGYIVDYYDNLVIVLSCN